MERIRSINAERIAWCCADLGITLDELACKIDIASTTLAKAITGEAGLTFSQLRRLASFFGRGTLFFLAPEPINEAKIHTPQFRTLSNQKPELSARLKLLIERVEKQREIFLSLREGLDGEEVVHFLAPALDGLTISEAAKRVRNWLGLTDKNSFDTYRQAIEAKGVLVFRSNGYNGKWQIAKESPILGFSLYSPECPVIVVKKLDSDARQSFTLMHELGHLLLHRASSIDDDSDFHAQKGEEYEANAFAGHLLVPDSFLGVIQDDLRPVDVAEYDEWLSPQRHAWGVSGEMILRRLMDANRLSKTEYAAYREWSLSRGRPQKESGSREYRCREPKHVFGDGYVRTVLDALEARRITLAKASSYLDNLKIADLHKLESYYAGV